VVSLTDLQRQVRVATAVLSAVSTVPWVLGTALLVAFSFAMVAYCHELDAAFRGRRPPPGTGARVALHRAKRVAIAGFVVGTGGFAFPAVATTDATIRETFEDVLVATESAWGGAAVTTLSTQALGTAIAWAGIVPAMALLFGGFAGIVPYFGRLGPLTLPLLVGVGGLVAAIGTQFAVDPGQVVETGEAGDGGRGQVAGPT